MADRNGGTMSVWMVEPLPDVSSLQHNTQADVCVIGAGIVGLTTAFLLAQTGRSVVILEAAAIGGGETGRTTAHLTAALDDRYYELERLHGPRGANLAAASHQAAIQWIESTIADLGLQCEFERVDGYLFVPPDAPTAILEQEFAALHRAGLTDVELVDRAPLDCFDTGPCLRFPQQAQFHPIKYLAGLTRHLQNSGVRIFTQTQVTTVEDGAPATVHTANGAMVVAHDVVVATNTPINNRVMIHTKQAAYRSYVIGLTIPRGSVPAMLLWDTADPYHYVRVARSIEDGHDLLIVGGEDHKTGQDDQSEACFDRLEAWSRERFPMAGPVAWRWSGQIMEPVDGLAFIGRNPFDDHVYIATGDSGNGMTHGTLAAMLLRDVITGRSNPWADLYDPHRITLRSLSTFAQETANVAVQYADWLTVGEVDSVDAIPRGSGAVMREGLMKVAIYRDENDTLHRLTAECPHLGCIVAWNASEQSWDCPCHGSRFDRHGAVLNGPAITPLANDSGSVNDG